MAREEVGPNAVVRARRLPRRAPRVHCWPHQHCHTAPLPPSAAALEAKLAVVAAVAVAAAVVTDVTKAPLACVARFVNPTPLPQLASHLGAATIGNSTAALSGEVTVPAAVRQGVAEDATCTSALACHSRVRLAERGRSEWVVRAVRATAIVAVVVVTAIVVAAIVAREGVRVLALEARWTRG